MESHSAMKSPSALHPFSHLVPFGSKKNTTGRSEVIEAKVWKGSATLSMAYVGAIFANACFKELNGVPDVIECSFAQSTITELPFIAFKAVCGMMLSESHMLQIRRDYGGTLNKLKKTLAHGDILVFVSDRHDGIIHVARTGSPHAEHGYVAQHILGNIRAKFRGSTTRFP
ncbi:unnamed protein product [Cuscuta epithymum]|uniref:Lactate/malate dehydrogenase C-terminal domain-containing protein n=1 Tax=Cuscuta epithymum TaxID=186058 RepID=A0AAV0FNC9_9ASTE|nr:unnamed protein product [Cuscuta epithymum]